MTVEQVQALIREQAAANEDFGFHPLALAPLRGSVILRGGTRQDEILSVWFVGATGGYHVVLRDDAPEFGLAVAGFANDNHPVLIGWYGDLKTALACM